MVVSGGEAHVAPDPNIRFDRVAYRDPAATLDDGILTCECCCEGRYVLEVDSLDRDGRGKLGINVFPDVASADGHGKRGGGEGGDDGTADVTSCLGVSCQAHCLQYWSSRFLTNQLTPRTSTFWISLIFDSMNMKGSQAIRVARTCRR